MPAVFFSFLVLCRKNQEIKFKESELSVLILSLHYLGEDQKGRKEKKAESSVSVDWSPKEKKRSQENIGVINAPLTL